MASIDSEPPSVLYFNTLKQQMLEKGSVKKGLWDLDMQVYTYLLIPEAT